MRIKDWRSLGIFRQGFYKARWSKWSQSPQMAQGYVGRDSGLNHLAAHHGAQLGAHGLTGLSLVWLEVVLPEARERHMSHCYPHPSAKERLDGEVTMEANLRKRRQSLVSSCMTFVYTDLNSSSTFYVQFTLTYCFKSSTF